MLFMSVISMNLFLSLIGVTCLVIGNKYLTENIRNEMVYRTCPFCENKITYQRKSFNCNNCDELLNIKLSEGVYINHPFLTNE